MRLPWGITIWVLRTLLLLSLLFPSYCLAQSPPWEWCKGQRGLASDITVDTFGNSFALVSVYNEDNLLGLSGQYSGSFLVKLDTEGVPQWSKSLINCGVDRLVHAYGHLYAAGEGWGEFSLGSWAVQADTLSPTYFIAKLDLDGNVMWMFKASSQSNTQTGDIAVRASGEVFVTGSGYGEVVVDGDTVLNVPGNALAYFWKLDPDGSFAWLRTGGCQLSSKTRAKGAAIDQFGNFYATGYTSADPEYCDAISFGQLTIPVESSLFIAKLSNSGDFDWVRWGIGALGSDVDWFGDSILVITGSAYASVEIEGQPWFTVSQDLAAFVAGFDSTGQVLWTVPSFEGVAYGLRLAVDSVSIWACADSDGPFVIDQEHQVGPANHALVLNLTPTGQVNWIAHAASPPGESCALESTGFALGGDGAGYVSGYMLTTDGVGCSLDFQTCAISTMPDLNPYWTLFVGRLHSSQVGMTEHWQASLAVYPNPCGDMLNLEFALSRPMPVKLLSIDGRVVTDFIVQPGRNLISTSAFSSGTYFLEVGDTGKGTQRVVVQH